MHVTPKGYTPTSSSPLQGEREGSAMQDAGGRRASGKPHVTPTAQQAVARLIATPARTRAPAPTFGHTLGPLHSGRVAPTSRRLGPVPRPSPGGLGSSAQHLCGAAATALFLNVFRFPRFRLRFAPTLTAGGDLNPSGHHDHHEKSARLGGRQR